MLLGFKPMISFMNTKIPIYAKSPIYSGYFIEQQKLNISENILVVIPGSGGS